MLRDNLELNSGLVRFRSKESASAYMETLLQYYKAKLDEYGQQLGVHLRNGQESQAAAPVEREQKKEKKDKKEKTGKQVVSKGWTRVGSLPVSVSNTDAGISEVTLKIVDDYKMKVEKVGEALKSFKDVDQLGQMGSKSYTLFMYRGVPEGIVIGDLEKRAEAFVFSASFKAV